MNYENFVAAVEGLALKYQKMNPNERISVKHTDRGLELTRVPKEQMRKQWVEQMLAKYRAREVRDHLIKLYNIDPNRLIYKGVGKIKNVQSPFAPNRRVLMYLVTKEEAEEVKKTLKQEEE